jgi:RNA polymerase sigma-70 factor (ECF subfamily)
MSKDETELIAHIVYGSHEQYRLLVDRHKDSLYRHCFYILRDEDDAEDAAQETFVRAFMKLRTYDAEKASFKTWLFTVATRLCLEQLRKNRPLPLEHEEYLVSPHKTPSEEAQNAEIHEAVLRLKPKYRTVVTLHYWHGYSYEEIARCMNVPIGSVRGWLFRAKKELKEALS